MNCNCNKCNECDRKCACPEPFLGIEKASYSDSVLEFNFNGKKATYDFQPLVDALQTDTYVTTDLIKRLLIHRAERHTDNISAQDLGAILHMADIGDVDTKGAETGSMMVYKKDNSCGTGCVGTNNIWEMWNALDTTSQNSGFMYPMGYNADGYPQVLSKPQNANQTYLVAWNGNKQVSYFQPTPTNNKPAHGGALYWDDDAKTIVFVREA